MEKEKLYHIALDDYEHGVVIRSLNDEKTKLMEEGKSADAVDDLLVKVGNAPLKKFKVIERKRSDEANVLTIAVHVHSTAVKERHLRAFLKSPTSCHI